MALTELITKLTVIKSTGHRGHHSNDLFNKRFLGLPPLTSNDWSIVWGLVIRKRLLSGLAIPGGVFYLASWVWIYKANTIQQWVVLFAFYNFSVGIWLRLTPPLLYRISDRKTGRKALKNVRLFKPEAAQTYWRGQFSILLQNHSRRFFICTYYFLAWHRWREFMRYMPIYYYSGDFFTSVSYYGAQSYCSTIGSNHLR